MLRLIVRVTLQVGFAVAFVTSILYALFPRPFLELLTDKQEVLELALSQSYPDGSPCRSSPISPSSGTAS